MDQGGGKKSTLRHNAKITAFLLTQIPKNRLYIDTSPRELQVPDIIDTNSEIRRGTKGQRYAVNTLG